MTKDQHKLSITNLKFKNLNCSDIQNFFNTYMIHKKLWGLEHFRYLDQECSSGKVYVNISKSKKKPPKSEITRVLYISNKGYLIYVQKIKRTPTNYFHKWLTEEK